MCHMAILFNELLQNAVKDEIEKIQRLEYVLALTKHSKKKTIIQNKIKLSRKQIDKFIKKQPQNGF